MISCNKNESQQTSVNDEVPLDIKSIFDFDNMLKDQLAFDYNKARYLNIFQPGNGSASDIDATNSNQSPDVNSLSLAGGNAATTNTIETPRVDQEQPLEKEAQSEDGSLDYENDGIEGTLASSIEATPVAISEKPVQKYNCQYCNKSFTRPSSLTIHTYTHTGEKPHECTFPGCKKRFSVLSNLRRHLKLHKKKQYIQLHNSPYSARVVPGLPRNMSWDIHSSHPFATHKQNLKTKNPYILPKNFDADPDQDYSYTHNSNSNTNPGGFEYMVEGNDFDGVNDMLKHPGFYLDQQKQNYYYQERQESQLNKSILSSSYITNTNKVPAHMGHSVSEGYLYSTGSFGRMCGKNDSGIDYFSAENPKYSLFGARDDASPSKMLSNYDQSFNSVFAPEMPYGLNLGLDSNSNSNPKNNSSLNLNLNSDSTPLGLELLNNSVSPSIQHQHQQLRNQGLYLQQSLRLGHHNPQDYNQSPNISYIDILTKGQLGFVPNTHIDTDAYNTMRHPKTNDYPSNMNNAQYDKKKQYENQELINRMCNLQSLDNVYRNPEMHKNTPTQSLNKSVSTGLEPFTSFPQRNYNQVGNTQWIRTQKELENSYYLSKIYSSQI